MRFFGECVREALADSQVVVTETRAVTQFARFTGLPERFLRDDQPLDDAEVQGAASRWLQ